MLHGTFHIGELDITLTNYSYKLNWVRAQESWVMSKSSNKPDSELVCHVVSLGVQWQKGLVISKNSFQLAVAVGHHYQCITCRIIFSLCVIWNKE